MIKAVLFDFDGTLSNRNRNAYNVFKDYLKPYFTKMTDMEYEAMLQDFITYDCNGTIKVPIRLVPFMNKYGKELPEGFEEQFCQFYYDYMWKYCELHSETIDVLKKLKQQGYKMAILSNGQSKSQHDKIDAMHIDEYFDEIFVSGDFPYSKPDPRIFEDLAKALDVKCEECMFVGDVFASDILGCMRANMVPCWIVSDIDRPADFYKGIRIQKLDELLTVLEKENH